MKTYGTTEVAGTQVLVELVQLPGSEPTGIRDAVGGRIVNLFESARSVAGDLAVEGRRLADTLAASDPGVDEVEIQFGISLTAEGRILLGSASAGATLAVTVKYARAAPPAAP